MTLDLSTIRALTFDVGGTVFDWHSTIRDEMSGSPASAAGTSTPPPTPTPGAPACSSSSPRCAPANSSG